MAEEWRNWSGGVRCHPQRVANAADEAAVAKLVHDAGRMGKPLRITGAGHSFSPVCASNGIVAALEGLSGVIDADRKTGEAWVWAGTRIADLGEALKVFDLGLANQGDIDRQTIAGAISTSTHGTGIKFGTLSTQVAALRVVNAEGDLQEISPAKDDELFRAAAVSMGLFGVITQVRLKAVPAYRLHEKTWAAPFEECKAVAPDLIRKNEHFEFFWVPNHDACAMKCLNATQAPATPPVELSESAPPGTMERYLHPERVDWSNRIYPSSRTVLFNEMEFALPFERGWDCLEEIRKLMQTKHRQVTWVVEYRTVAADDLFLSPAQGRQTIAISIHQAADANHEPFFRDAQAIFLNHGGRPHWGKIQYCSTAQLRAAYPHWDQFWKLRREHDPKGVFLNDYLAQVGGVAA
jgi:FAD/FMN-containing dehydrogenase